MWWRLPGEFEGVRTLSVTQREEFRIDTVERYAMTMGPKKRYEKENHKYYLNYLGCRMRSGTITYLLTH